MDQLSRPASILNNLKLGLFRLGTVIVAIYSAVWSWLQVKVPLFKTLVHRHVHNPATVFIDAAIFILVLYLVFGVTGFVLIYPKKAETRFAETLSTVYPLPAAKINTSFVWSHRFLERLRFLNTFNAQAPQEVSSRPPTDTELRTRVLEGLIEDKIIVLEARKRGLRVTGEELEIAFDKQGKPEEIEPKIRQLYSMSLVQFKEIIAEQVLKEKVKDAVLGKVRVRHILTLDLPSAQEAKRQISAGKDFAEAAKEFSQDAKTAESGGDLGYWRKGELAAQNLNTVEEAAGQLPVNGVSDPLQTQFGFHVIQITERIGDNHQTYEEWYKTTFQSYQVKKYIRI